MKCCIYVRFSHSYKRESDNDLVRRILFAGGISMSALVHLEDRM
jgi:hypothetical protein